MEKYTIRILYRDRNNPEKFVGVVEGVEDKITHGFVSMKGLWRILNSPVSSQGKGKIVSTDKEEPRSREELIDLFCGLREK